jgi:hypothetical protein
MSDAGGDRPLTPTDVERRLIGLSQEIDSAHEALVEAEHGFQQAKAKHEIEYARAFMQAEGPMDVRRYTAVLRTERYRLELAIAEASQKAARENVWRLRTHSDLARSVGTLVRESMTLS